MADTFTKPSITSDLAQRVVAAAEAKAAELGHPFVIAVVDESGVLKAFSRMDGAALLAVQVAQDKAYTAIGFGLPTDGGTTSSRTTRPWPPAPRPASTG